MREILRQAFRPARVKLLFIGESPPASGRFFYARNSGLYRAMREVFQTVDPSIGDQDFLGEFAASGCYLIDLCPEPVDRLDARSRRAASRSGEKLLAQNIAELQPEAIASLLRSITASVGRAVAKAEWQGTVISLPYPGRWSRHRTAFVEALAPAVRELMRDPGR